VEHAAALDGCAQVVEREPLVLARVGLVRAEVDAPCAERLRREDADDAMRSRSSLSVTRGA
jgi:hypothetical protein